MRHKLLFVGDIVLETEPVLSPALRRIFDEQTIRCCNLEAPLRGKGYPIAKTGPVLNQRNDAVHLLQTLGFSLFAMANNHIYDYGEEGLNHTLAALAKDSTIGVGNQAQAYGLLIKTIDGVRYGFVAYGENGYGALEGEKEVGYAWINHPRVRADIADYKTQVDLLIVQVHAGVEMIDVPIPEWRNRYRELIDSGADVVIGHHPHMVQGMEYHHNKPIFYSLGNFYFDGIADTKSWNTGAMLELEVENGQLAGCHLHIVEKTGNDLHLHTPAASQQLLDRLSQRLTPEADYFAYVDQIAVDQWHKYHAKYYAKAFNGFPDYSLRALLKHLKRLVFHRKTDYNLLWHNLKIESNLWIVQRAMQRLLGKK